MNNRPLRAVDAAPLVEGCVTGEPLQIEEPDLERLAEFWEAFYDLVGRSRARGKEEEPWSPDTPPAQPTSCH